MRRIAIAILLMLPTAFALTANLRPDPPKPALNQPNPAPFVVDSQNASLLEHNRD